MIYGCESSTKNLASAIARLMTKYDVVIYVDDKPDRLNRIKSMDKCKVIPVHHVYRPSLPRAYSWIQTPGPGVISIYSLYTLPEIVRQVKDKYNAEKCLTNNT